jgi:hypothetical protein
LRAAGQDAAGQALIRSTRTVTFTRSRIVVVSNLAALGTDAETVLLQGLDRAEGGLVATYKMIYGDDENVVEETLDDITAVESEDGWIVLFRQDDAILRVEEDHVQSLELVNA